MNFSQAIRAYFKKWNDFKSRSSRSEYWWGTLGVFVISLVVSFTLGFTVAFFGLSRGHSMEEIQFLVNIVMLPFQIYLFIAGLALSVRRLHDINKSGWWYLIGLTIIGFIPLVYWAFKKGDDTKNRFGENPLT
ncbi:hypothetical protein DID76_01910 [Candidatus Marinamargulisbacteria bacterium SCGC AG-414-C22]|nr:hypothetical protein DID76_01910 [Candidatus Marinamargulisbacteria bacterium SCGC AG-414-C22]